MHHRYCKVFEIAAISLAFGAANVASAVTPAHEKTATVHLVTAEGEGKAIGTVSFVDKGKGVLITPHLKDLPPGEHGFHIHENPSCAPKEKDGKMMAAGAAGGHLDPAKSGKHLGPQGGGHAGDLPKLIVKEDGTATSPVEVEGLTVSELEKRSIMIHAGGDNYSDSPEPLGGGGARFACGVIE